MIDDNGRVLWDSSACLVYLARKYGGNQWLPTDPGEAGEVQQWIALASNEIQFGLQYGRGIVRGARQDGLTFQFTAREDDVRVGDVIITSGLGGVYPRGLRIGEVVSVQPKDPVMLQTAELRPAADFGRLEQVFVMLRRGPTMELLYATGDGDTLEGVERATP